MLDYNEVTARKYILVDGHPYEVLDSWVFRKQQRKPVNQTKLKSLLTGKVAEVTFHQNDRIEEADMGTREVKYLYTNRGEDWFCDPKNPADRFKLSEELVGDVLRFIKVNSLINALTFNGNIIGIKPPVKVVLLVKESAPAVKGNTAQGAMKDAVLETGTTIKVPLFINEGDLVTINTETGDYVDRAEKGR
jgi:elongation factor P